MSCVPPAAVTAQLTVVEWVALAPVPVTVIVKVPVGVVAAAVKLSVELAPAVTLVGVKVAVAFAGRPVAERATFCATPEVTAVETVDVAAAPPCADETLVGLALIEKSFVTGVVTVQLTLVVCVADAAVPVTVRL